MKQYESLKIDVSRESFFNVTLDTCPVRNLQAANVNMDPGNNIQDRVLRMMDTDPITSLQPSLYTVQLAMCTPLTAKASAIQPVLGLAVRTL